MRTIVVFSVLYLLSFTQVVGQSTVPLQLVKDGKPLPYGTVTIKETNQTWITDSLGQIVLSLSPGEFHLKLHSFDTQVLHHTLTIRATGMQEMQIIQMTNNSQLLDEIVVSGGLREVNKLQSIVPVEVYNAQFFKKNSSSTLFDALQGINGVRPQVNCNLCNTGDIHINGLEGPYTMILIDGMPILSNLATVYGLNGIPNSLIEQVEIVRGPSSSLYGSEAIGGIINVRTKLPEKKPRLAIDLHSTSWMETNLDISYSAKIKDRLSGWIGLNYFNYSNPVDLNQDNFTDLALQNRFSIFQKIQYQQKKGKQIAIAGRYFQENRWGGEMNWTPAFLGGDSIYGESIQTKRLELFGKYELPIKEKITFTGSITNHQQESHYGTTPFDAEQRIAFGQLIWIKKITKHDFILGTTVRKMRYDDSTPATTNGDTIAPQTQAEHTFLPGIFLQDEWQMKEKHALLVGMRYDYSNVHKGIFTPRLGYKYTINKRHLIRLNTGTGYRVVSIFTEDHAALSGARETIIKGKLNPEKSVNFHLNYYGSFYTKNGSIIKIDVSPFYTYFSNKILPDYTTDPTKIIYENSKGFAENKGINCTVEWRAPRFSALLGATLMEVTQTEDNITQRQILSENFSGNWSIRYSLLAMRLHIDYTGVVYSPMLLPVLGPLDPRPDKSPWWSIQNIQVTYKKSDKIEFIVGVKNLLNWTPGKKLPFLIARSHDPFDKLVTFQADGSVVPTAENPYGLTFDPTYVYASNQGIRLLIGLRFTL